MQKLNLTLALAAGLLGGFISRNFTLPTVNAQTPAPAPTVPVEIRAQRFTLVDAQNRVVGTFTFRGQGSGQGSFLPNNPGFNEPRNGPRSVILLDPSGREIWSGEPFSVRPLSENLR